LSAGAKLVEMPLEPDGSGVLEAFDKAQELVASGRVSMIAITIIERDGCPHFIRSKVHNRCALVGALARQQHRLMAQFEEEG
jgi:hypothetical protein